VIPVRNEARFIERTLGQLVTQDYDPQRYEVLVVDGESTDGTPTLVAEFAQRRQNVRLLSNPKRLSSAARNIGIRESRGDVVVIVDGHCEIADDRYLAKLADAFDRSGADCIGRPQPLDVTGATTLQRAIAAARSSWLGHHPDSIIYSSEERFVPAASVAVAYRRSVFERIGYFDERFDACEDVELNHRVDRAGLRCYFTPEIAVRYTPRDSLHGLFRQLVRYGRGRVRLARKHPQTIAFGTFIPAAFVSGLVVGLPASLVSRPAALLYLGVLLLYLLIITLASTVIVFQQGKPRLLLWLPLVFVTVHVASGAGMLLELPGCRRGTSQPSGHDANIAA
jgi:succinoglycan biosynthesis protein ExoA